MLLPQTSIASGMLSVCELNCNENIYIYFPISIAVYATMTSTMKPSIVTTGDDAMHACTVYICCNGTSKLF